jgi:hypothetical protein
VPLIDVAGAAHALLDLVLTAGTEQGVALPARRYITAGAAGGEAWDCEQLTVGLVQLGPMPASGQAAEVAVSSLVPAGAVPLAAAVLRVEIVRCAPVIDDDADPPDPADETAAGEQALQDAALLHLVRARAATLAALTSGSPGDVRLGSVIPSGPQGGYAAMALTVAATITATAPDAP